MLGSFFWAYPVSGSFSRTAVNFQAGAKTQVANMVSQQVPHFRPAWGVGVAGLGWEVELMGGHPTLEWSCDLTLDQTIPP